MDGEQFQVLPEQSTPHYERRKLVGAIVVVLIVALAVGFGLWWNMSKQETIPKVLSQKEIERNKMTSILNNYTEKASPKQLNQMTETLSKVKSKVTDADRQKMADLLKSL